MKLSNIRTQQLLLMEMGAKKICTTCGHPMANYHFYRNGGWHCKNSSLQNPGPTADKAAVAAALAGGSKAVPGSTSSSGHATPSTPKVAATPTPQKPPVNPIHANIANWLTTHGVSSYTINSDGSVDVNGDLDLAGCRYNKLPVKFNKVTGDIHITKSSLKTLEGLPKVIEGDFELYGVDLDNLANGPSLVKGSLNLEQAKIGSWTGSSIREVGGNLNLSSCKSSELKGMPDKVGGDFIVTSGTLATLTGMPAVVGGSVELSDCRNLTSLSGIANTIGKDLWLSRCGNLKSIASLGNVGRHIRLEGCKSLKSVVGLPQTVAGDLNTHGSSITGLEGFPSAVEGNLTVSVGHFNTLHNIHKIIKSVGKVFTIKECFLSSYNPNSGKYDTTINIQQVLGILLIKGLKSVKLEGNIGNRDHPITAILNRALSGDIDIHDAQEELIDAGYTAQAKI